jgi:hypothetical protein
MTHVDLSQSAHHVTSMFDLPVLEDADSIQITLGQIMRMIVCRQVDTKSAGLLLYGLQIASANLRRTHFEPYHRNVTVDLFRVPERIIGDEAWSPSDFKDAHVGRAPSPAKSCVVATLPEPQPAAPSPAKDTHVARTPSSSDAAPAPPAPQPEAPSPTTQPAPASDVSSSSLPSATQQRELQKAARAIPRALKGDWRDVKTMFEFAGIYPAKDNSSATDP